MAAMTPAHAARAPVRRHVGVQLGVGAGQVLAGIGNLAFSMLAARLLAPDSFATLTAFLSLSLLVAVPAGAVAAGSVLSTDLHDRVHRHVPWIALVLSVALGGAVATVGPAVGLPRSLAIPAGALPMVALALALARGRLYAMRRPAAVVTTLVAEPAVRLGAGVALLAAFGATGGAAAIVAGGAIAAMIARGRVRAHPATAAGGTHAATSGALGVAAFLGLALLQNQDVLIVNARMGGAAAGAFAALSMLGGAALFAVWNAPLVLMPDARDDPGAVRGALFVTTAVGVAATVVAWVFAEPIVTGLVGQEYAAAVPLLGPYVAGMAMLGLARVFAGARCADGRGGSTAAIAAAIAAVHAGLLVLAPDLTAATAATVASATVLAAAIGVAHLQDRDVLHWAPTRSALRRLFWSDAAARIATIATAVGLGIRLTVTRGLWLDEAITVMQVRLPFGEMIEQIGLTDVHPPLHQIVLWGWTRVAGDGEVVVRLPFILAGAALVPLLFAVGRDLYSRRAGAVAAVLGAVAPLAVWYSQETRMYSLYMLFSLVAVWGQARAMRRGRASDWGWFVLGTAGLLWTHWFALLQVLVQQVVMLVHVVRRWRSDHPVGRLVGGWYLSLLGMVVLVAPLATVLGDQLDAYSARGAGLDTTPSQTGGAAADLADDLSIYRLAVNAVWTVTGYHANETMILLVALWPLAMLAAFVAMGRGPWRPGTNVLVAVATVPMLTLFGLGALKSNLFEVRYVIGALPCVLVLVGRLAAIPRRRAATVMATVVLAGASVVALADQQLNADNPRLYAFDEAIEFVAADVDEGDVVVYAPPFLEPVLTYYAPQLDARPLGSVDPNRVEGDIHVIASFIDEEPQAGIVGARLAALEEERGQADEREAGNVSIWTFS